MNTGLGQVPLFASLATAKRVLVAGAGGGCDVFCGLPLYFALKAQGCEVHLANLTFADLFGCDGRQPVPGLVTIDAESGGSETYFPERRLSEWFLTRGEQVSVHCFHRNGVKLLLEAYEFLVQDLDIDAIVLVDGGTDSLARGDETGLGTPEEDMASLAAVHQLQVERKYLVCIGFGVDAFHGICHAQFLEAVADVSSAGGYLGAFSLLPTMPEVQQYQDAVRYLCEHMRGRESIVNTSINAAVDGKYGDHHSTARTKGHSLWINPLMSMYWCFALQAVANRCLYLDRLNDTNTHQDVARAIACFRAEVTQRSWDTIPV